MMAQHVAGKVSQWAKDMAGEIMLQNATAMTQPDEVRRRLALRMVLVTLMFFCVRAVTALLTAQSATEVLLTLGTAGCLAAVSVGIRRERISSCVAMVTLCWSAMGVAALRMFFGCGSVLCLHSFSVILLPIVAFLTLDDRNSFRILLGCVTLIAVGFVLSVGAEQPTLAWSDLHAFTGAIGGLLTVSYVARLFVNQLHSNMEALTDSMMEARKACQAKSIFIANISHEFRTPLHAILAAASFLNSEDLSKENRVFLNTIISCGDTLKGLVANVLDLSRIEADVLEWNCAVFDMYSLMEEVATNMATVARTKRLPLVLDVRAPPSFFWQFCYTDRARLKQIMSNLVDNAIKFTNTGEVTMTVQCLGYYPNNDKSVFSPAISTAKPLAAVTEKLGIQPHEPWVPSSFIPRDTPKAAVIRFEVSDTGVGIAPSFMADLFKPFSQSALSAMNLKEGAGLGLCVSQQFTQAMGGEIRVESELGKGSRFWFDLTLPLTNKPPECVVSLSQAAPCSSMLADVRERRVIGRFLSLPDLTSSGRIVSDLLQSYAFPVDVMPQADLMELLKERRKNWTNPLSGSTTATDDIDLSHMTAESATAALRDLDVLLLDEQQSVLEQCLPYIAADTFSKGNVAPVIVFLTNPAQATKMSRSLSSTQRMRVLIVCKPIGPVKLLQMMQQFVSNVYSYYEYICERPRRMQLPNPLSVASYRRTSSGESMTQLVPSFRAGASHRQAHFLDTPPSTPQHPHLHRTESSVSYQSSNEEFLQPKSVHAPHSHMSHSHGHVHHAHNGYSVADRRRFRIKQIALPPQHPPNASVDDDSSAGIIADDEASASIDAPASLSGFQMGQLLSTIPATVPSMTSDTVPVTVPITIPPPASTRPGQADLAVIPSRPPMPRTVSWADMPAANSATATRSSSAPSIDIPQRSLSRRPSQVIQTLSLSTSVVASPSIGLLAHAAGLAASLVAEQALLLPPATPLTPISPTTPTATNSTGMSTASKASSSIQSTGGDVPPITDAEIDLDLDESADALDFATLSQSVRHQLNRSASSSNSGGESGESSGGSLSGDDAGIVGMATTPESVYSPHTARTRLPILIVEDNPINQMILKHLVTKKLGIQCEVVDNGRKALEAWSDRDFSLIFMDLQMPVMDGLTATREIRRLEQLEGRPHALIVAMTGLAFKEDREAAMEAGCDEFLSKPVDMEMLQSRITSWLSTDTATL